MPSTVSGSHVQTLYVGFMGSTKINLSLPACKVGIGDLLKGPLDEPVRVIWAQRHPAHKQEMVKITTRSGSFEVTAGLPACQFGCTCSCCQLLTPVWLRLGFLANLRQQAHLPGYCCPRGCDVGPALSKAEAADCCMFCMAAERCLLRISKKETWSWCPKRTEALLTASLK